MEPTTSSSDDRATRAREALAQLEVLCQPSDDLVANLAAFDDADAAGLGELVTPMARCAW